MYSAENREELARACGKFLLATRMASVKEVPLSFPVNRYHTIGHLDSSMKLVIYGRHLTYRRQ